MSSDSMRLYLRDLGLLLKEKARGAKDDESLAGDEQDRRFRAGRLMAFHEVISLMQQQARAFQIPLEELCLDDIDPERELL